MAKMPAFQFYPADWRKDPGVQALGFHDRGVWIEILCLMHESDERGVLLLNGSPMPDDALARIIGLDKQTLTTTLTTLLAYGVASRREPDGALVNRRMVRDEKLCQIRREAGKLGGNPALLNQNPTTPVNQNPTPSSSSSSSSSTSVKEVPPTPTGAGVAAASPGELAPPSAFYDFWNAYPRKVAKPAAGKAWNKLKASNELVAVILKAIESQKKSEQWTRDDGKFIPHPASWLNQRRWEDEEPPATTKSDPLWPFTDPTPEQGRALLRGDR